MKNTKKSAIDLTDLAIGIVVLGIVVSIGATILIAARDSRLTDLTVVTTKNESVIPTTSGTGLSNSWVKAITFVQNESGAVTITSGNYTTAIDGTGKGTIANLTADQPAVWAAGSKWNVTYQWYNTSRADWSLANNSALGLGEYGNWFKIIVIVGVAALVLSIIFMAFGRSGSAGGIGGTY